MADATRDEYATMLAAVERQIASQTLLQFLYEQRRELFDLLSK